MTSEVLQPHDQAPTNESKERVLRGLNVFITGGTRDIGAAILKRLLQEGVNITTTYSRASTAKTDVPKLQQLVGLGSRVDFVQADLTTPEGLESVFSELEKNKADILILNTSGAGPDINITANQAILSCFLDIRKRRLEAGEVLPEALVIFMQSHMGHYAPQIIGAGEIPSFYGEGVAPFKYEGEQQTRQREQEMSELNTKLLVVCPPEVPDTVNMRVFAKRWDPESVQKSHFFARQLGLPESKQTSEVGEKVIELIKRVNLPNGYIELFDQTISDATLPLSRFYVPETMYVTTMQVVQEEGKEIAIGRYIANPKLHGVSEEPPFIDSLVLEGERAVLTLQVTTEHMRGHPWAFPGHKSIRTMEECVSKSYAQKHAGKKLRLVGYDSVTFRQIISAGDTIQAISTMQEGIKMVSADVNIQLNDTTASQLKGAHFLEISDESEDIILPDQLIEGAAQAVITFVGKDLNLANVDPIFGGTEEAKFYQLVKKGDNLLYRVSNLKRRGGIFFADVRTTRRVEEINGGEIIVKEEEIADIDRVFGLIRPKEVLVAS